MRGEAMALTRLTANLLDNAIKHVPAGTRVRRIVGAGPIIAVEDNGTGVAPHDREPIFRRFHRASEESSGHRLGLALVRVIAAQHGLTARVEDARPGALYRRTYACQGCCVMIRTGILLAGVLLAATARGDGARSNFERTVDALAVG